MFKIIRSSEAVKTEVITALIYGEPGIGKTSLAFTSENPLLLDFDSGIQRAAYRQTSVRVESWSDVIDLQKSKEFAEMKPKTIIIDTVGAMLDNYISQYVLSLDPKNGRRGGELSLQGYGAMKTVFKQFKDWSKAQKCNLVFVSHAANQEEGDNLKFIPKVTGGSYDILRQECDLIGYMESYQNKRTIVFSPTDRNIGKDCANLGRLQVPDLGPEFNTYFTQIIQRTIDHMNQLSEAQQEILSFLTDYEQGIAQFSTEEHFNKALQDLTGLGKDRAVKIQMAEILKREAKKHDLEYNGQSKAFEPCSK